jgi:thioredoxin 1
MAFQAHISPTPGKEFLSMVKLAHVSEAEFGESVLNSKGTVLVDFYADWCGPCKMIAPALEELAVEYKDRLTIVKVDVDHAQAVAGQYGIQSIPTMIFFQDGKPAHKIVGALPKPALRAQVEKVLSASVV